MICKDDLVLWFKNLESYRRIDVMCTLLNLCLPFELRFLGTCLEELGRRDAQDLRGVELRVNNPLEFVSDVGSFQTGQPTDMKIRRKMALYLALMRACNRTGVNELFKTLDRWGDRDFSKFGDGDSLQELLLVYTMATNHPVFSFEQRQKCGEIFSKITSSRGHQQQSSTRTSPITSPPPFQSGTFQPQPPSASQQQLQMNQAATQLANPILMPIAFQPTLIPGDPTSSALAMSVESLPSHLVAAPQNMVPIPTDFTTPPPIHTWRYQPAIYPAMLPIETQQFPPLSDLSQPSSPAHSRTGSPSRQQQQQAMPNQTHRNTRGLRNTRPSTENTTTPPPPIHQQQQQQQQSSNTQGPQQTQGSGTINYMGNDIMVQTTLSKNFDELNMDAISQLHSKLQHTMRNGYNRPSNTIPRHNHKTSWNMAWQQGHPLPQQPPHYVMTQQQQQQQQQHHQQQLQQKSATGSESGSSAGDMSPPPSQQQLVASSIEPGMHGNANQSQSSGLRAQALNLSRLNGGNSVTPNQHPNNSSNSSLEFNSIPTNAGTLVSSNSSGNLVLVGGQLHNITTFPYRNLPGSAPTIQRQFPPQQVNGEMSIFPFNPPTTFINITTQQAQQQQQQAQQSNSRVSPSQTPALPTPFPINKLVQSCFNCGSTNHTGLNCSEASMEDVTRNAIYKLDYTVSTQSNSPFASTPVMTTSSSLGNLNISNNNNNINISNNNNNINVSNNNNSEQLEPSITFIDLTQDTSSDSSR